MEADPEVRDAIGCGKLTLTAVVIAFMVLVSCGVLVLS